MLQAARRSLSPSFELEMNEETLALSKEKLSLEKEEGWWTADLEGGKEKLAVKGAVTSTARGSKSTDRKDDHRSPRAASTKEEGEGVRLTAAESQEDDEVLLDVRPSQPSSNEAEGDIIMCEVGEQQAARVEVQAPKRRAVIRVESEGTQDYVLERRSYRDLSQEEFVPSALSEHRGAEHLMRQSQ